MIKNNKNNQELSDKYMAEMEKLKRKE